MRAHLHTIAEDGLCVRARSANVHPVSACDLVGGWTLSGVGQVGLEERAAGQPALAHPLDLNGAHAERSLNALHHEAGLRRWAVASRAASCWWQTVWAGRLSHSRLLRQRIQRDRVQVHASAFTENI